MARYVSGTLVVLLGIITFTGCHTQKQAGLQDDSSAPALRVMSFNIRYNNPNDGEHAWPNRAEKVASVILFHQADLVGVQEALHEQITELSASLPGYEWIGVGRDDGKQAGEYSAIFYRSSAVIPQASGTFWLSATPEVPGSIGWDAAITRVVTWARFTSRASGQSFYHFNTHFDHRGPQARLESARLVVNRVEAIAGDLPAIVTGDFNFTESAEGYTVLTQSLTDAYYASAVPAYGAPSTFYGGFTVTHEAGRRIDYIFTNGRAGVQRFGTLSDNWDGHFPSDHLPVLAEIVLP